MVKMSRQLKTIISIAAAIFVCLAAPVCLAEQRLPALTAASIRDVNVTDQFWAPRIELNRTVTIPHVFKMMEETGTIDKFVSAAASRRTDAKKGKVSQWWNTDEQLYKAIEGASFSLIQHYDPQLIKTLDDFIAKITAAQQPDGYLHTQKIINLQLSPYASPKWSDLGSELELYLAGHLYEAAVAHYQATGKRTLLNVAIKNADLVAELFGPDKRHDVCGHPEIELALIKLYKATGDKRYLDLARFFVDQRGRADGRRPRGAFSQDHKPIIEQTEAVGQALRAMYLYCGVTDLATETNDANYASAMKTLWEDVVGKKMYITGGIGSRRDNEGFGEPYDLPNKTGYAETCAAIGLSMWNFRMFLLTGDAKYIDVLERTIYNNFLAGVSLGGSQFFYENPLESDGIYKFNQGWVPAGADSNYKEPSATRKDWFFCGCCPPNVVRFLPSISQYIYATDGNEIFVNLFIDSTAAINLKEGRVALTQQTQYPWDGYVKLMVNPEPAQVGQVFTIKLRIPCWAMGWPVPSRLYRYIDSTPAKVTLKVNGQLVPLRLSKGFAIIQRSWNKGDIIELNIPMVVHRVISDEKVKGNADRVALERGPIVYCTEGIDNGGCALGIIVTDDVKLRTEHKKDLLGGVTIITGQAYILSAAEDGKSFLIKNHRFTATPYYAWSNRGIGEMAVWLHRSLPQASRD